MEDRRRRRGVPGRFLSLDGLRSRSGQSTLEFLIVAMSLAAACVALAAMWRAAKDGRLLALASRNASHTMGSGVVAALKDISGY